MGVFDIVPRTEVLQPSRAVSPVRRYQAPSHVVADASTAWRGAERLGRGVTDLARAMMQIGADMAHERNMIEDNETEAAFVDAMRQKMDAPDGGLLQRIASAWSGDALQGCVEEGEGYFKSAADDLLREKGYSGDRKRRMALRLDSAASPFQRTMAQGVLRKTTELKVSSADRNFNSLLETWRSRPADEESTRSVIDAFRASQRVRGLADDAVEENAEKVWRSMAYDYVTTDVGAADRSRLDWIEARLADGRSGELLAFNQALAEHFDGRDPFGPSAVRANGGAVSARDGVRAAVLMRRQALDKKDGEAVDAAANLGTAAVAAIRDKSGRYPADRLQNVEEAIEALGALAKTLPRGGRAATDAAARASDLDAKADMIAQQEMIEAYLGDLEKDPDAKIYVAGTRGARGEETAAAQNAYFGQGRKERLAPLVQQMVDQQRARPAGEMRKARVAELKMRMLSGARNPGDYHNEVFRAAKDGEIELGDYLALVKEFDESWAKGFETGRKSPKQTLAEQMLGLVQEYFPSTSLASSFEWDAKASTLKLRKDADYEGLEYEVRDRGGFWRGLFDLWGIPPTSTTHKMDASAVEKLVNVATALSFYDGRLIDFDPITGGDADYFTGERIKTGKDAPAFSAAAYFRRYLQRLSDESKATGAAEYVMRLVEAESRLGNSAADLEERRAASVAEAAKSRRPSVVQVRNRKAGEGVTTKR